MNFANLYTSAQRLVAADPDATPAELEMLISGRWDSQVAITAALNPSATAEILLRALARGDFPAQAVAHSSMPAEVVAAALKHPIPEYRKAAVINPTVTAAQVDVLYATETRLDVKLWIVARAKTLTDEQFARLIVDPTLAICEATASNVRIPSPILDIALTSTDVIVRVAAAANRAATIEQIVTAGSDRRKEVRQAARSNPNVPGEWLGWLSFGWSLKAVAAIFASGSIDSSPVPVGSIEAFAVLATIGMSPKQATR